jgi:DNA-directed RNA polymerase subunit F
MSEERFVTLSEVEHMLTEESKERELTSEQKLAKDHADKIKKLPLDEAQKLYKELKALDFISDAITTKIVDILPTHNDDVRILFAKERLILEKKHIDQILKTVEKYL